MEDLGLRGTSGLKTLQAKLLLSSIRMTRGFQRNSNGKYLFCAGPADQYRAASATHS
jgi:hypothetical protein